MLSTGYTGWRSSQYRFLLLTAYGIFNRGRLGGWLRGLCRTELVPCKRGGRKGCPSGIQGGDQVNTVFSTYRLWCIQQELPGEMVTLIMGEYRYYNNIGAGYFKFENLRIISHMFPGWLYKCWWPRVVVVLVRLVQLFRPSSSALALLVICFGAGHRIGSIK